MSCPGSLIKVNFKTDNPICFGMPAEAGVFYRSEFLFATSIPNFDMDRRVLGSFSENEPVMSGYCAKLELLEGKPNIIWIKKNKGQLVLMAFNPQFRASSEATYKLIFNSLLPDKLEN